MSSYRVSRDTTHALLVRARLAAGGNTPHVVGATRIMRRVHYYAHNEMKMPKFKAIAAANGQADPRTAETARLERTTRVTSYRSSFGECAR